MSNVGLDLVGADVAAEQRRAMGDAVADMEDDGEELIFGYVASYMVRHPDNAPEHGVVRVTASSHAEAGWLAYTEVQQEYRSDGGWFPPSIIVDEQPFLVTSEVPYPVMVVEAGEGGGEEVGDVEGNS